MTRIHGLFLIVNTLAPAIVAILLVWGASVVWTTFATHLAPPIDRVVHDGKALAAEAADAVGKATAAGQNAVAEAEKVAVLVSAIKLPGRLKLPDIPDVNIPTINFDCSVPDLFNPRKKKQCLPTVNVLGGVEKALGGVVAGVNSVTNAVKGIGAAVGGLRDAAAALAPLADRAKQAQANFIAQAERLEQSRAAIRAETRRVETVAVWGGALLFPWLALSYLLWASRRLATGWRMLLGG